MRLRLPNQAEDSNRDRNEHGPSAKRAIKQQARRIHRSCFVEETIVEAEQLYEERQRDV